MRLPIAGSYHIRHGAIHAKRDGNRGRLCRDCISAGALSVSIEHRRHARRGDRVYRCGNQCVFDDDARRRLPARRSRLPTLAVACHRQHDWGKREPDRRVQLMCPAAKLKLWDATSRNCFRAERRHHNGKLLCRLRRWPIPVLGVVPANAIRKLRWTYAAALQAGAFVRSEFQVVVSNWAVTGSGQGYSIAGPGSQRIEDDSSQVQYTGTWTSAGRKLFRAAPSTPRACRDRLLVALTRPRKTTHCT